MSRVLIGSEELAHEEMRFSRMDTRGYQRRLARITVPEKIAAFAVFASYQADRVVDPTTWQSSADQALAKLERAGYSEIRVWWGRHFTDLSPAVKAFAMGRTFRVRQARSLVRF